MRRSHLSSPEPDGMLLCTHCGVVKNRATDFYTHGSGVRGGWCKACRCESERQRRLNPENVTRHHARYETDMEYRARVLLSACQKRCRRTGTEFSLDVPWMADKMRGCCELTGLPFDMSVRSRRPGMYTPSIDRIVPGMGYTKDNCRIVLFAVNLFLKDFTVDAILPIAEAFVKRNKKAVAA